METNKKTPSERISAAAVLFILLVLLAIDDYTAVIRYDFNGGEMDSRHWFVETVKLK